MYHEIGLDWKNPYNLWIKTRRPKTPSFNPYFLLFKMKLSTQYLV